MNRTTKIPNARDRERITWIVRNFDELKEVALRRAGGSFTRLAEEIGVPKQTVNEWWHGRSPGLENLDRLLAWMRKKNSKREG